MLDFEQLERIFTIAAAQDLREEFSEKADFASPTIQAASLHNYIEIAQAPLPSLVLSLPHSAQK